jgi:glycosyltransferase involved in cell wall biosynthesis
MPPKITVLMPVYNGLAYIRPAIESVLSQTCTDFEFLIVDDASTDASVECIRSYTDSRIRLVRNESNLGQAGSLNRGLELAQGSYIARLDQDDVCLPERLQKQADLLDLRPDVAVISTWEYTIDSQGRKVRSWRSSLKNYGAFLGALLVAKCPVWHPSVMFRQQSVVQLGSYDASYAPADDFDLWSKLAMARCNAAFVPEYLVLQRVHGERQSVKMGAVQLEHTRRSHDKLIANYCSSGEASLVAMLLRMEESFWSQCTSKGQLGDVLRALNEMLSNIRTALELSPQEYATLTGVVHQRLGSGVAVGRKIANLPPILFYPVFFGLSPLLIPRVRPFFSSLHGKLPQMRYPGRLIQSGMERIVKPKTG